MPGFHPQQSQPLKFAIFCSGMSDRSGVFLDVHLPCQGFVSHYSPHKEIYGIPDNLPTLHSKHRMVIQGMIAWPNRIPAVDDNDGIVPAARTVELKNLCKTSILMKHNEGTFHCAASSAAWSRCSTFCDAGHSIPVRGQWPKFFRDFILNAVNMAAHHGSAE